MKRAPTNIPKASKQVILEAAKLSAPAARFLISGYWKPESAIEIRHRIWKDSEGRKVELR